MTVEEMIEQRTAALQTALASANSAITAKGGTGDATTINGLADAVGTIPQGGSSVTVEPLSVTENGTYTAPTGKAYSPVTVNVQGGGEATITIVSPTTTCAEIADALRAAVSASITRFIAIRELPHGTDECVAVCWSANAAHIAVYSNELSFGGMRRYTYGDNSAPVPQGAVFKIYGWGD